MLTLECDISIPSESQSGAHPFLPGDVRLPYEGAAQVGLWVLKPGGGGRRQRGCGGAARRETSPDAKPLVTIAALGLAAEEEERFL